MGSYLTQEQLESTPIGTKLWLLVHHSIHFSGTLTGIQNSDWNKLGLILIVLDDAEMVALFRGTVPEIKPAIALMETSGAGLWAFTECNGTVRTALLRFSGKQDLQISLREGQAADITADIRRLRQQLQCVKEDIIVREMRLMEEEAANKVPPRN